jgi:hypothetical protein
MQFLPKISGIKEQFRAVSSATPHVIDRSYAVAWLLAPQRACFACGSMVRNVFFVRFGGFAAKTNEINSFFRPTGGEKALAA